jgi:serine/threonine protein kinase
MNRTETPPPGPPSSAGTPEHVPSGPDDPRVIEALREYLAALEAGQRPNRREFLDRHPETARALAAALDGLEFVHSAAPQLRSAAAPPAAAAAELSPAVPLGDYRIVREVGRGGMGVVYEAVQLSLGRRVALKVLPLAAALDPRPLQRFRNEAQAAAQLHHPHIVPVYGLGQDRGVHYYAMQFVDGFTLAQVIADLRAAADNQRPQAPRQRGSTAADSDAVPVSSAPLLVCTPAAAAGQGQPTRPAAALTTERSARSPAYFRTVARLGRQAAEALEHAHQLGVVHRDVKPGNLMVDTAGHLWVTDFGLARFAAGQGVTLTGDVVGTLRYASPEQVLARRGLPVDHRSDIYSLGATLYELLTLEPAHPGSDRDEVLRQIAWGEPVPPRKLNTAVPVELETILLKAMAREPERRYGTAQDLADDLGRFLEDRPIHATRPSLAERLTMWARRHRTLVRAAAVGLVLALIGLLAATAVVWQQTRQKEEALKKAREEQAEARRQWHRAEENFNQALSGINRLLWKLEEPRWAANNETKQLKQELTDLGMAFLRQFIHDDSSDPTQRYESARAHQHLAGEYGVLGSSSGNFEPVFEHLNKAAGLYETLANEHPQEQLYWLELAHARYELGVWHNSMHHAYHSPEHLRQAGPAFSGAFDAYRRALFDDPDGGLHNRLAYVLANCPLTTQRNPAEAIALAREAIARDSGQAAYWNTLGSAYCRAGDYSAARAALDRSMELKGGADAYDWLVLALMSLRRGDKPQARRWYDQAVHWMDRVKPPSDDLFRCRFEVAEMLGIPSPAPPGKGKKR